MTTILYNEKGSSLEIVWFDGAGVDNERRWKFTNEGDKNVEPNIGIFQRTAHSKSYWEDGNLLSFIQKKNIIFYS